LPANPSIGKILWEDLYGILSVLLSVFFTYAIDLRIVYTTTYKAAENTENQTTAANGNA